MTPIPFPGSSLLKGTFVCESCLSRLRVLRSARLSASPLASTASFSSRATAPIHSLDAFYRTHRVTAPFRDPQPKRSASCYRSYSTASPIQEPASSGLAPLSSRRLVSISGPDAAKFLQGLLTNNVDPAKRTPFYSAFLDARGRVLWDVFIWVYPDLVAKEGNWACYIEVDAGEAESLVKHLRRHKLRSKINIKLVEESEMGVWAAWGTGHDKLESEGIVASFIDPRGPGFSIRYLFQGNHAPAGAPVPVVDSLQYHLRRYLYGIPEGPQELQRESALPMECNIDLSQGIDFKKGCYVGQELTIRTKHTGVVRKRILPVQLYHSDPPPDQSQTTAAFDPGWVSLTLPDTGSDIKQLDEGGSIKKGRAAGKFIAGIGNVGLALCRLEMMTSMRISAEGGGWKPGVQFGIQRGENDEVVRVQAILPQWFRERERDVWDKNRTRV